MQPKTSWGLAAGIAAVLCFVSALVSAFCTPACVPSSDHLAPSQVDVDAYGAAQLACIEDGTKRLDIDACRWGAKAQFCARFPHAGNCQDGGAQ